MRRDSGLPILPGAWPRCLYLLRGCSGGSDSRGLLPFHRTGRHLPKWTEAPGSTVGPSLELLLAHVHPQRRLPLLPRQQRLPSVSAPPQTGLRGERLSPDKNKRRQTSLGEKVPSTGQYKTGGHCRMLLPHHTGLAAVLLPTGPHPKGVMT